MKTLYKDQLPELDRAMKKTAAFASRLSEQPEQWPQELTSDLYKQLPFLSDYEVNVNLDKVDAERGYAFGNADVTNKTERPEQEHDETGIPHIRIPLIIKERQVKPFSVFMDQEKVLPLNEERVREKLFNPATFDLSTTPPQDPSLVEPLMPPQRSGIGMGGDYKLASVQPQWVVSQTPGKLTPITSEEELVAALQGTEKTAFVKQAFKHISKEQWDAIYGSLEVQKLMHDYGGQRAHPAVQNKVYEMAVKHYGYHPKPEPPPPQKLQEYHQKQQEKQQKMNQKQMEKGQKMLQEGQKAIQSVSPQASSPKSKTASLLLAIAPTVRESDRQAFLDKIASSGVLTAGLRRSGIGPTLLKFASTKLASANERLMAVADSILPSVVTIQKLPGGDFFVKQANNEAFAPGPEAQGQVVPPEAGAEMMGQDQAQAMQPGQSVTAVGDPAGDVDAPMEDTSNAVVAEQFGEYLAQDLMGNQVMGWVFPTTLSWDGEFSEQPVALFTNGSAFALQDTVAGELIGKSTQLPISPIRGEGCFYEVSRDGVRCTAPITVRGGMSGPDGGPMYQAQDFMGNELTVHMSPELQQPQRVSDTEYAIPATWKFMALNNQTQLVPDPSQMGKTAAVKIASQKVTLFWNGSFNLTGGCGLDKIARDFRHDLDPVSAEFMLGLLGVNGSDIKEKLSQARKNGEIDLYNLKTITPLAERYQESVKTASAIMAKVPDLRRDLLKEAAALDDESTVDKVLALNFVNPENLSTFVEYAPELEATSEKLAEMLLSSYLGMEEIPEGAVERTMKNMEEVLLQLKAVEHAES